MGGLVYNTSKWADSLWAGHAQHSAPARQMLADGSRKQHKFRRFAEDVHSLLYLRHTPERQDYPADTQPTWAQELLSQAEQLPEFQQLKRRCASNGFAAGISTEQLLTSMLPLLPQQKERPNEQQGSGVTDDQGTRRALRHACRVASAAADEATQAVEGMATAFGLQAGKAAGKPETLRDIEQVRKLYALLRNNPTMRDIAELAGRLQRFAASHKRSIVTPAVGMIKGIEQGGDPERLLPSEIVGLRSQARILRLQTLNKILTRQALQYKMAGEQPEARGPICICIDESPSMAGSRLSWAKAVALALLTTATQQKRPWYLCGFNTVVTHEHLLLPGEATVDAVVEALSYGTSGGTSFDAPLIAAFKIVAAEAAMHKADVLIITDGEGAVSPEVADTVLLTRKVFQAQLYAIGIGARATLNSLTPIATACYRLSAQPDKDGSKVAPLIALAA